MSNSLIPLSSYGLEVHPGLPILAIDDEYRVAVRITMAAVDPSAGEGTEPSTLKIIRRPVGFPDDGIMFDSDEDDLDDLEDLAEEEEQEEDDGQEKPKKVSKKESKKEKKEAKPKKNEESDEDMEGAKDEDEEDDEDDDFEIVENIICTLSPSTSYQQPLDLVIMPDEEVLFEVSGSYPIHLTGNYVDHPYDSDEDDYDDYDSDELSEDNLDSDVYDLSPDEDEIIAAAGRIEELADDETDDEDKENVKEEAKPKKQQKKEKTKESKKREAVETPEKEKEVKKQKKDDKKSVAFSKDLEQGPSGKKQVTTKTLEGGVIIEDRKIGEGPVAKKGQKVGVRYIGKLSSDGSVFDSNTNGKPFFFTLGKGEVIKGWDVGVAGMAVKGERRIVIPAPMAYGKQKLPGIPANSKLTFDVKLISIK